MSTIAERGTVESRPSAPREAPRPASSTRDAAVDLVRAVCVAAVVVLHALMVGVSVGDSGPVFENAAEGAAWFAPVTWLLQVMPLFFVIGGFSGATAYRRARAGSGDSPGSASAFVAARLHRLLMPAAVVIAAMGAVLTGLVVAGLPAELVAVAGYRFGQPLWFLAVFLLLQALLPALLRAHEAAPRSAILTLAALAVGTDVVRGATGADVVGLLNLGFVWGALQQLGFFLADGKVDALRRPTQWGLAGGSAAILALGMTSGVWSPDLVAHLNPPTCALLLVGVAHTLLFSLLRPRLTRWSAHPAAGLLSRFVNARAMTIYLWHMPVLLTMAGLTALGALQHETALPLPGDAAWWWGRPLWVATALCLTAVLAAGLGRIESRRGPAATGSGAGLAGRLLAGLVGLVILLTAGTTPLTALAALCLLGTALQPRLLTTALHFWKYRRHEPLPDLPRRQRRARDGLLHRPRVGSQRRHVR